MRKLIIISYAIFAILLIASCATRGTGPQGGPQDVTPPRVVKYSPADGSTNMQKNRIEITFDEIVVLQNPNQKIVISPPQTISPEIKALSHKIIVEFIDTLLDSTTYSIDFTDAIADNNEGNKLEGFTYSFSTGDHLDSLQIAGKVLRAQSLNPVSGIYVGVHAINSDTAFTHIPFTRISKTNNRGEFCIRNLHQGSYRIFALQDIGGNYIKDMPGEEIAFLDSLYTPTRTVTFHNDTTYNKEDTTKIDTIITRKDILCTPTDILLHSFIEEDTRRYLTKVARPARHQLQLQFNGKADTLPTLTPLNFDTAKFNPITINNLKNDTITYWLPDTSLWSQDTLQCILGYDRIDLDTSYYANDTISFIFRHAKNTPKQNKSASPRKSKKDKDEKQQKQQNPKLIKSNASNSFDIYKPIEIRFDMPTDLRPHDTIAYHLEVLVDTLWKEVPEVQLLKKDESRTLYTLEYDWKPATSYRLIVDSSLCLNMIGQTNDREQIQLKTKSLEEYSKLILHLTDLHGDEIVQLLDGKDNVVRQIPVNDTSSSKKDIIFEYVKPETYYIRIFRDINHDGCWTTGLYSEKRQAEPVIYFPYDIELRAFWDVEEDWNPYTTRLGKPKELIQVEGTETKK